MNTILRVFKHRFALPLCLVLPAIIHCLASGSFSVLTADQQAFGLFARGDYNDAAQRFDDPMWKGVALLTGGDFKEAATVLAGLDTAEAAFNHGNALVMQGKYENAVQRYQRALELAPDFEAAEVNRGIAVARAELIKKEGGDMTGGEMGADDIVFSTGKPPPDAGDEQSEEGGAATDASNRAVWLRQVQTKPADFLRAKFAHQWATRQAGGNQE